MLDLQDAFNAARDLHPEPLLVQVEADGELVERRQYCFIDADLECGRANPAMRGRLVLHETRSSFCSEGEDDVHLSAPRNHWGFTITA